MLILPDSTSLGDTHLSPEENVAKLREGNRKMVQDKKLPNQKLLEDKDAALGAPLAHQEFIRRLRLMKPSLIIQDGGVAGAIALRHAVNDPEEGLTTRYVTGFYKGVLPEFSSILTDSNGLPTREIRGWRTVLLTLIHCKIATYAEVKAAFGEPHGQRGILWREQMQDRKI
jgi:hypothetical protein